MQHGTVEVASFGGIMWIDVEFVFCNEDTIECYPKNGSHRFITHYKSLVGVGNHGC